MRLYLGTKNRLASWAKAGIVLIEEATGVGEVLPFAGRAESGDRHQQVWWRVVGI